MKIRVTRKILGKLTGMTDKDTAHKAKDAIKDTIADAKDATNETLHRSAADAERTRREVEGESMTPGEKVASGASEAKHRVEAEIDKTKRNVRDRT